MSANESAAGAAGAAGAETKKRKKLSSDERRAALDELLLLPLGFLSLQKSSCHWQGRFSLAAVINEVKVRLT